MAWAFLLAVMVAPMVEIALFIRVAQTTGFIAALLMLAASGAVGLILLRAQGVRMALRTRAAVARGEVPLAEAFDGLCLTLAGLLLLLPGFGSDLFAVLLLLAPVRAGLRRWLGARLAGAGHAAGPTVIEGEYRVVDEQTPPDGRFPPGRQ